MDTLEIIESGTSFSKAIGILILWPSTGGNARSFRIRDSELEELGLRILRFNPPSHGNSRGTYDPEVAIQILLKFLKTHQILDKAFPIYGIGHSGGGAGLCKLANEIEIHSLYLLSPILDSVESLRFLYRMNRIHEFVDLLLEEKPNSEAKNSLIQNVLRTPSWLNSGEIEELDFPIANKRIQVESLASFLRNLFLPGFSITEKDLQKRTNYHVFLPNEDHWFPMETTKEFAEKQNWSLTQIKSAPDHFFSSSFLSVWNLIKIDLKKKLLN